VSAVCCLLFVVVVLLVSLLILSDSLGMKYICSSNLLPAGKGTDLFPFIYQHLKSLSTQSYNINL
jgi:hypothetical protein